MTEHDDGSVLEPVGTSVELPLPKDPTELLSEGERISLRLDLNEIARGRREAETASANLRLS